MNNQGYLIGLHAHSHPTLLERISFVEQTNKFEKNLFSISNTLGEPKNEIKYMLHLCESYNNTTLEILKELTISLGLKQIMTIESEKGKRIINNSFLKIAREDYSTIYKRIN